MANYIVTGGTGAIGRALIKKLVSEGNECYVLLHRGTVRGEELKKDPHCHVISLNLDEYDNMIHAFNQCGFPIEGYEAFFHLAWDGTAGNFRNDMGLQTKNIQGALDAVDAAYRLHCKVFVGSGSQAEYGRFEGTLTETTPCFPENGYGMAKLCAGYMTRVKCETYAIRHEWARILSIYGPYDRETTLISTAVHSMLHNEDTAFTPGEQIWDYLYSDDVAEALYLMSTRGRHGRVYVIGSGKTDKLSNYIKEIAIATGYNKPIGFGKIPYFDKQVMYLKADITPLKIDCGFEPKISFEDGIRKLVAFEKSRG